jgi:hypothetical protein
MVRAQYFTRDGAVFDTHKSAERHELSLFGAWLNSRPELDIKSVLDYLSKQDTDDDDPGTLAESFKAHLYNYWQSGSTYDPAPDETKPCAIEVLLETIHSGAVVCRTTCDGKWSGKNCMQIEVPTLFTMSGPAKLLATWRFK